MRNRGLVGVSMALLTACGARVPAPAAKLPRSQAEALVASNGIQENGIQENGIQENGLVLNGIQENGIQENGIQENGIQENGIQENGIQENGIQENGGAFANLVVRVEVGSAEIDGRGAVRDAHLEGSALVGHHAGAALGPADFVGAHFKATRGNGWQTHVRITAHRMGAAPDADLDTYLVQWHADGAWHPMCPDGKGGALYAVPVYGYWDYSSGTATGGSKTDSTTEITFACPNGAIGKCINAGYRPWSSYAANGHTFSLAPYHQACTRLIRADYCGDGTPHTKNGETIELYDNLGIQVNDRPSWIFEAQWAPSGATCLNPTGVGATPPVSCFNALARTSCTADDPGAMLSTATRLGRRIP